MRNNRLITTTLIYRTTLQRADLLPELRAPIRFCKRECVIQTCVRLVP